jgi:hypothetical protein
MSSNGRASLCLGSKQDAKGIIPNDAPNTASPTSTGMICTGQVGFVAILKHFPGSGFLCSQAESTPVHLPVTHTVGLLNNKGSKCFNTRLTYVAVKLLSCLLSGGVHQ